MQQTTISGNEIVGKVTFIIIGAKAQSLDGSIRDLQVNSPVYAGDRLITGPEGRVSIEFSGNGERLDLGRQSNFVLDEDTIPQGNGPWRGLNPDDLRQALLDGELDPTVDLEAPAAGFGIANGGGGHHLLYHFDWTGVICQF